MTDMFQTCSGILNLIIQGGLDRQLLPDISPPRARTRRHTSYSVYRSPPLTASFGWLHTQTRSQTNRVEKRATSISCPDHQSRMSVWEKPFKKRSCISRQRLTLAGKLPCIFEVFSAAEQRPLTTNWQRVNQVETLSVKCCRSSWGEANHRATFGV